MIIKIGKVKIQIAKNKIKFTINNVIITSKLLDGAFPDYERVIPENNTKELIVNKQEFIAAVTESLLYPLIEQEQ